MHGDNANQQIFELDSSDDEDRFEIDDSDDEDDSMAVFKPTGKALSSSPDSQTEPRKGATVKGDGRKKNYSILDKNAVRFSSSQFDDVEDGDGVTTFHKNRGKISKKTAKILAVILVFLGVAVASILGFLDDSYKGSFFKRKGDSSYRLKAFSNQLVEISGEHHLKNHESPQYKALMWISETDPRKLDAYDDYDEMLERYALAVFFFSLHGNTWYHNTYWLTAANACDWENVECFSMHGKQMVAALHLFDNRMRGSIPKEINLLPYIQNLDLAQNDITGTVPDSISSLQNLKELHLESNKFKGVFPSIIFNLEELSILDVSGNLFSGTLPSEIGNLVKLQVFSIEHNNFTSTIPNTISGLKNLEEARFGSNRLQGTIPKGFGNSKDLNVLSLSDNGMFQSKIALATGNLSFFSHTFCSC